MLTQEAPFAADSSVRHKFPPKQKLLNFDSDIAHIFGSNHVNSELNRVSDSMVLVNSDPKSPQQSTLRPSTVKSAARLSEISRNFPLAETAKLAFHFNRVNIVDANAFSTTTTTTTMYLL